MSFGDAHLRKRIGFSPEGTVEIDPTDPIQVEKLISMIPVDHLVRALNSLRERLVSAKGDEG